MRIQDLFRKRRAGEAQPGTDPTVAGEVEFETLGPLDTVAQGFMGGAGDGAGSQAQSMDF